MVYLVVSAHWGVDRVVQAGDQDRAWGDVVGLEERMGFGDPVEVLSGPKAIPRKVLPGPQRQEGVVRRAL